MLFIKETEDYQVQIRLLNFYKSAQNYWVFELLSIVRCSKN